MNLTAAIEAFNESSQPQINVSPTRAGSMIAYLPRVDRQILVEDSRFTDDKVTAEDIGWLCEEARRAFAPGMALLEAGLSALSELERE
jgi:hypothetical protein